MQPTPPLQHKQTLGYIPCQHNLHDLATRLKHQAYRGAITGPTGSGKSITLQALGDELMQHGLSPLPLNLPNEHPKALPQSWRRTIRAARHTDALLLDNYHRLPLWARAWVCFASRRAGAVVVTADRGVRYKTVASLSPTPALLQQIVEQTHPTSTAPVDYDNLLEQSEDNLHRAIELARQALSAQTPLIRTKIKRAS